MKAADMYCNRVFINTRRIMLLLLVLLLLSASSVLPGSAALAKNKKEYNEYDIKAACIYNFMKFIKLQDQADKNKEEAEPKTEPIVIGIIGKNPFGKSFAPIIEKKIRGRKLLLKEFLGYKKGIDDAGKYKLKDELRQCELLFVCSSEKRHIKDIVKLMAGTNALTVGEFKEFLDGGGIINFVTEKNRVQFEVNVTAAETAKLKIRSQLLRLAKRVIKVKKTDNFKQDPEMMMAFAKR